MSVQLEVAIIGAVAAIIGGLLAGASKMFYDWLTRPVLKLDYDGGPAYKVDSEYVNKGGQTVSDIFVRARIQNIGRRVAKNCRVFLKNIEEVHHAGVIPTAFHDSMPLCWPHEDFDPRDIPKGVSFYINVVSVSKHVQGWRFWVEKGLYASHKGLREYSGTYRLTLIASADDADPVEFQIEADYHQDWHNFRAVAATKNLNTHT